MAGSDIGYYTLPVILSFKGIDSQVEASLGKSMQDLGKKTGEQLGTAVVAQLDPTKSPKVSTAIKSSSGAGKKMGDAITTEVAKNIDGKKISDKMSATITNAVQGDVGKKIGQAVSATITKNFDPKPLGKKIEQGLTQAQNLDPKAVGKKISDSLAGGIDVKRVNAALKDFLKEPLNDAKQVAKDWGKQVSGEILAGNIKGAAKDVDTVIKNTTSSINSLGKAVGLNLDSVEQFGNTAVTKIDSVAGKIQSAVDQVNSFKGTADNLKTFLGGGGATGPLAGAATIAAPALALGLGTYELAPGYKQNIDSIRAQAQGQKPFAPGPWAQQTLAGALPGGQAIPTMLDLLPKEYDWAQRNLGIGDFHLPKRPEWLGGEPDKTKYTRKSGEEGHYWYAPGEAAKAAAPATTVGGANVQAQQAMINIGSAVISGGVSIPATAAVPVGGSASSPQSTAGRTYKYASGGEVPIVAHAGEHVFTQGDVNAMGGQAAVYDFRRSLHYNGGGAIKPPPPPFRRPYIPNRAAIKGVSYGGSYDDGGEIKELAKAVAPDVAKAIGPAVTQAAATGAAQGAGAKPAILGGPGGQQQLADVATQLLGIGAGGLGETVGLGSLFPDPMNNPNVKSLMALGSAFKGPLMGALQGKLGIQQAGWRPGMPVAAMANNQGPGASIGLPFGLPGIDLPNAPDAGPGSYLPGQPGGGGDTHVDASLTVHGDVGSDQALRNHQQQIQRGLDRLAPMPTGPN